MPFTTKYFSHIQLLLITLLISIPAGATLQNGQKFKDWVSRCDTGADAQVCFIEQNLVSGKEKKQRVLGVQIGYYQKKVIGNFILPLGVLLKQGVRIVVDGFEFSQPVPYTYCDKGGCSASFQLDEKMIGMLKKGKKMEVIGTGANGKEFSLPVSLNGFTQAFSELTSD